MSFEHPAWLWLVVPAIVIAVLDAIRRWPATRWQRLFAVTARVLVIAALAAAAAGPHWIRERRDATVVFLIDRSASVGDDALAAAWTRAEELRDHLSGGERAAVVEYDATAVVAIAPGEAWTVPASLRSDDASRDGTDLAGAIRLGLGLIPPDVGGHLVVLGDGRSTDGDLAAATTAAVDRGVPVSVIPTAQVKNDPAVAAINLASDRIRPGATLTGKVDVDAGGVIGQATLTVKVGTETVTTTQVALDGTRASVPFTYSLPKTLGPGVAPVEATLTLPAGTVDGDPGNDRATSPVVVEPRPHILILDGDDGGAAPLAEALRSEQMDITVTPAAKDGPPPDLATADLVILANAPVRGGLRSGVIDDDVGEKLVRWVNDGGGLIVLAGPSALEGNYAANRIADALPVEIEPTDPELDEAATVIVILDQSGSMGAEVGGKTKLALAAEGASAVIRLLRSFDQVAVMSVEDIVHWVVPMRLIGADSAALETKVRAIPVGGDGIFVYTSLVAARDALKTVHTPLRHVILFSDTFDAAEQVSGIDYGNFSGWPSGSENSFAVAQQIKKSGATLSVIGVGEGADNGFNKATYFDDDDDTDFLRQLAVEGGGRYFRTSDAKQLRALFVQDTQRLLDSDARDEEVRLTVVGHHPALDGIDLAAAPPLHGYLPLKARPAAQVVVANKKGDPILTHWPYGLGEVAVWASDAGPRWADDWVGWPGYERFWTQMVRAALRRREGDTTAIEVDYAGDAATVRVVSRRDTDVATGALTAKVIDNGHGRELPLKVEDPGVYAAKLDIADGRPLTVEVRDADHTVVARRTVVRPASTELRDRGPDIATLSALAAATHGKVAPATVSAAGAAATTTVPLTPWLLLLAALLLPIDAALRRIAREKFVR